MAVKREDINYRGHRIIANETGAMIYLLEGRHKIDGANMEDCLSQAKAFVDAKHAKQASARRAPHIGTVDDYSVALSSLKLGAHEVAMLSAHSRAPDRKLTATELSSSAGWEGVSPANSHYGRLGKRVADCINLKIDGKDDQAWTEALGAFDEETRQWQMHSELALAIERLNIS